MVQCASSCLQTGLAPHTYGATIVVSRCLLDSGRPNLDVSDREKLQRLTVRPSSRKLLQLGSSIYFSPSVLSDRIFGLKAVLYGNLGEPSAITRFDLSRSLFKNGHSVILAHWA